MAKVTGEDLKRQRVLQAEQHIRQAIIKQGPFSHNICSMALSMVADVCGYEEANKIIKKFELTDIYGIQPITKEELT